LNSFSETKGTCYPYSYRVQRYIKKAKQPKNRTENALYQAGAFLLKAVPKGVAEKKKNSVCHLLFGLLLL